MKYFLLYLCLVIGAMGQEIARQKCQEYAKAVYQKEEQMSSLLDRESELVSTCAIFDNPLIIGGTIVKEKQYPHMAVLGFGSTADSRMDWICGGSLISEKHVLTAAHCAMSDSGSVRKVKLGAIHLEENIGDNVQEIGVCRFLIHPLHQKPMKYHDIAILFLERAVIFSAFVRPACLNTIEEMPYSHAKATGFGKTAYEDEGGSPHLLEVTLNIIPKENCSKYMKFRANQMPRKLIKEMMCAANLEGGHDTCQGDSGGPLQVVLDEPYCMYSIIGITSFGRFCGMAYSPGIYTKVDQYLPWIESEIWF